MKMTDEQIQMLRRLIQDEISYAGIDCMEHGAWGWADKQLNIEWKEFQKSFETNDKMTHDDGENL